MNQVRLISRYVRLVGPTAKCIVGIFGNMSGKPECRTTVFIEHLIAQNKRFLKMKYVDRKVNQKSSLYAHLKMYRMLWTMHVHSLSTKGHNSQQIIPSQRGRTKDGETFA